MTVTSEVSESVVYDGDGSNAVWPYGFYITSADEIVLYRRLASGDEIEVTSGFTVSGVGLQAGGNVTYPLTSDRVAVGEKLRVARRPPLLQPLALTNDVNLYRRLIEQQLDRSTFMAQWLSTLINRGVRLPATSTLSTLVMPTPSAGKLIGWNSGATGLANYDGAGSSDGAGTVELHDLVDDGVTDQSAELEALIAATVAAGEPELRIVGAVDGTSEILIDRRVIIDAMPASVSVSRVALKFNAANSAGIYIRGQEVELPESGKAKLWADVDVSEGAVTAFDIDVSSNASIVDLLVAGAIVIIRGENGADGDVLDGHRHEDIVVSCVQVAGTRYTLTLTNGLPDTIDGSVWKTEWPDSEHTADPDETLISVLAMAPATANLTDSRTMTIAAGKAAALGLDVGSWVEVIDDATGSDTHGTSAELLNRQTVRIAAVEAGTPDTITFDEPVRGTFTTANRARLVLLTTCAPFKFQGPGPAFPIRVVGTPPASPASRRHLIEAKYCISPELTGWFYEYVAADGSTRGAPIRDSHCYEPWVHHNGVANPWPSFAGAYNGGDYYCAWSKGSTRPLYEHNTFVGGRHSLVIANAKGGTARFNHLGYSGFQCLDYHGENEIDVEAYGNEIVAGPDWDDRSRKVAIQVGNQTHTFGAHGTLIRDNAIIGFDAAADVGVLIVSGCSDIIVDQHFIHPVGEAVRIDADNRAPDVMIERITIAGSAPEATIGVVIDGRMQVWESEGEVSATASRPVYIDDSTGTRRYVTEDAGTLGTVNPTHETGTETSGDIDLEYVGPVSSETVPIDGVRILADLTGSGTGVQESRADNVVYGSALPIDGNLRVIQLRHGTAAELASANPTLADGEAAFETDTGVFKLGYGDPYNITDAFGALLNAATQGYEDPTPTVSEGVATIGDSFLSAAISINAGTIEAKQRILAMIDAENTSASFYADLSFGTDAGGQTLVVVVPPELTGTVTLRSADHATGGLIDGAASRVMPASGMFVIRRLGGSTKHYRTSIEDNPVVEGTATFNSAIHEKAPTANWTGAVTLDLAAGQHQVKTLTGNVTGITLSNRPPDGYSQTIQLTLIQDGTGSRTVVWPTGYKTPEGAAVAPTAAANAKSRFVIEVAGSAGDIVVSSAGADIKTPA